MKWYAHKSRICRDISVFVGCTKNLNQCNANGDSDGGVTVIALHILRIVELKMPCQTASCLGKRADKASTVYFDSIKGHKPKCPMQFGWITNLAKI